MHRAAKPSMNLLPLMLVAGLLAAPIFGLAQSDSRLGISIGDTAAPFTTDPAPTAAAPGAFLHERARMTEIIGARVYNDQNEHVGEVDDILLRGTASAGGAAGPVAVLQVGGFVGSGGSLVSVPLNNLRWSAERERIMLPGASRDALRSRPTFSYSALPRG